MLCPRRVVPILCALFAVAFATSCATMNHPPERKWPAQTPGSYPGTTHATQNGEWWFPSMIGPKEIPAQGGNRGTIFFLKQEMPASAEKVVTRTVYKPKYVDKRVTVERFVFPLITFDQNSADFDADAQQQLQQAADAIQRARGYNVIVEGHADAGEKQGIDATRADAARKALAARDIDRDRLMTQAYGNSRPLSKADTPLGHELNRRVAFTLIPLGLELDPKAPEDEPMPKVPEGTRVETVVKEVTIERPQLVYQDRLVFPNILFDYDKANLRPDALQRADRAAAIVKAMDNLSHVTVIGHTDSKGSEAYNDQLSVRRAQTVHDHLIANGVTPGLLSAEGRGERQPIATNDTPEGRQLNRRVEFEVRYTN